MDNTIPEQWLSVEEVAKLLQVHSNTIRRAIREKQLRANKIGKNWRITREAVEEYVAKRSNMGRAAA